MIRGSQPVAVAPSRRVDGGRWWLSVSDRTGEWIAWITLAMEIICEAVCVSVQAMLQLLAIAAVGVALVVGVFSVWSLLH